MELRGGIVLAIAGTSSANTIESPLEKNIHLSTAYLKIHRYNMPLHIEVPIDMTELSKISKLMEELYRSRK